MTIFFFLFYYIFSFSDVTTSKLNPLPCHPPALTHIYHNSHVPSSVQDRSSHRTLIAIKILNEPVCLLFLCLSGTLSKIWTSDKQRNYPLKAYLRYISHTWRKAVHVYKT